MSAKLYLDTNVYLDYYFDRKDSLRPLGTFAFQLMNSAVDCKFSIVLSCEVLGELCKVLKTKEENLWELIFSDLEETGKISRIKASIEDEKKAREFSRKFNIHFADSLHLILALQNNAILVSRDKHFDRLKNKFKISFPEELLSAPV